ncbi:MAG: amidophosphoribosyltransferase [Treponema sp.]|nr:amidophosphoribosyltransferase [Treponema sp.]
MYDVTYEAEGLKDACGVVGVFYTESADDSPHYAAALRAYFGLISLQHRGQESAGIAAADGTTVRLHKAMGSVSDVFGQTDLERLTGNIAVGHTRYATAGACTIENAQPMVSRSKLGAVAVAHNGQLVNYEQLREMLAETGATFSSTSDTEVIVNLVAKSYKKGLERALTDTIQMIKGSFALCVMTDDALIGARDPNGIRPLCLGQIAGGWVLASESCALDAMDAAFVRDVRPGEIVIITTDGVLSFEFGEKTAKRSCIFEYVYFARPDSVIDGISVQDARMHMGATLAQEHPVAADVVIGVPDSGLSAALGYARESGIPYAMGIVKSKYAGRTFIAPTQAERERMVFVKLNAIRHDIAGRRVVVIDDSMVRGTTGRRLVALLRRAGAAEVHVRVASPPVAYPCYFGIDTPTRSELVSASHTVEAVGSLIGADSLAFLSVDGMLRSIRALNGESYGYCKGCFTGEYPVAVPGELNGMRCC